MSYSILDDLLLLHYYQERMTIVIDIKSEQKSGYFGPPFEIGYCPKEEIESENRDIN